MHLSLSVEDTNRLRARLGLKLIPTEPEKNNTVDLIERISAARERANKRTPQPDVTPIEIPVKPVSIEPTKTWLNRINQLEQELHNGNSMSPVGSNTSGPTSIDPQPSADIPNTSQKEDDNSGHVQLDRSKLQPEVDAAHPDPQTGHIQTSISERKIPESIDPLDLPSEMRAQPSIPKQKAIFKTKKIKQVSKARERPKYTPKESGLDQDQYYSLLLKNARRVAPRREEVVENESIPAINSTQTKGFLETIKDMREEPDVHEVEAKQEKAKPLPENEVTKEEEGGNGMSVAETLQMLRTQRNSAPTVNKSRDWSRKLLQAREQREKERHELEDKVRYLPVHQREQALALHKERLLGELANDAKLLTESYEPNVVLEHHDEKGNVISPREAFKKMSRAFHGQSHGQPHGHAHGLSHDQ